MSMGMVNKNTAATIPAAGNTGDKVGNLAALHTTVKSDIVAAVNEVKDEQANKADMDIVADAFNAAETYAEGDYCTYEGGLYKFKTAHEGAWDAADVDQIKIAGELSELKNTLTSVEETVDELTANRLGSSVELTKNTDYVCPSDGYLRIFMPNNELNYAYGFISGNIMISLTTRSASSLVYEGYFYDSVFVRKGMTIKYNGGTSTVGYFLPII